MSYLPESVFIVTSVGFFPAAVDARLVKKDKN